QLDVDILLGVDLLPQLGAPRTERVRPSFDGEFPKTDPIYRERAEPAIAVEVKQKRHRGPTGVARPLINRSRGEQIVTFLEDVGADPDRVADDALHRVAPAIQLRSHAFD